VEYDFKLQQVDMLLAKMEVFIEAVMSQRRVRLQLLHSLDALLSHCSPDTCDSY